MYCRVGWGWGLGVGCGKVVCGGWWLYGAGQVGTGGEGGGVEMLVCGGIGCLLKCKH